MKHFIPLNQTLQDRLDLTQHQFDVLLYIFAPLELLSLLLVSLVIITYITFKKTKFPSRIVLCMAISVCLNHMVDIWILFVGEDLFWNHPLCVVQGLGEQFASLGSVLWWFCISVNLCLSIVMDVKTKFLEKYMFIFVFVLCAGTTGAAYPFIGFPQGVLCWINSSEWQFLLYYVPMALCLLVGGAFHIATIYKIRKTKKQVKKYVSGGLKILSVHIIRQTIFVCWFFLLFLFFFSHRMYIFVQEEEGLTHHGFWLAIIAIVCQATPGTFMFFIFGIRKEYLTLWRQKLCGHKANRYERLST